MADAVAQWNTTMDALMLKRFPDYGRERPGTPPFSETLRCLIVGRIHAGLLKPGDRLPSIRDVASRSRVDHRAAAHAYRLLEQEGFVEIHPKSGVFVSMSLAGSLERTDVGSWAADVLFDAWEKRISRSSLCGLFGGMLGSPLRCACVESNEDHLVAITAEVEDGLGLETVPILIEPSGDHITASSEDLRQVDLIVTSVFHAKYARVAAAAVGKPLAVMNLRREFTAAVGKRLSAGSVTVVIVDPKYANRGREFFSTLGATSSVRFLSIEEAARESIDPSDESVLVTRAARRRLGLEDYHLVPSPSMISADSARALCEIVTVAAPHRRSRLRLNSPDELPPAPAPAPRRSTGEVEEGPMHEIVGQALIDTTVREVEDALRNEGLFGALRVLNRTTRHRFTAVYRFESGWVRSVVLFDRENPDLRVGADVPMKESYCVLVADAGDSFRIENALSDSRLIGHHARNTVLCYCAVHLVDAEGASWGTLCHYDLHPAEIEEGTMAVLEAVRPAIEAALGPATPYVKTLPDRCDAIGATG